MLKKEVLDAFKRLLECLLVIIAIPLAIIWDKVFVKFGWAYLDIFKGIFITVAFIYSAYSGMTLFQSEKKDRAFEYLFTLPISKLEIIVSKILPRISILIYLIMILACFLWSKTVLSIGINLVFVFAISVFISLAINSAVIGFIGILLLFGVFWQNCGIISYLIWKLHIASNILSGIYFSRLLSAALLLIPFGIAFWRTFKRLDMKPLKLQMRSYYIIILPSLIIIIAFMVIFYRGYMSWILKK